jgi:hypothetical protein
MDVILWGLLWVLERTNKLAYWIALGALLTFLFAMLGCAYFAHH